MKSLALSIGLLAVGLGLSVMARSESLERPAGSGVIVHSDGYVLTAHHVIANARRIVVVMPGEYRVGAVLVSADQERDLALLKVETVGLSEARLGYAGGVRLDQEVMVTGYPFGLREPSLTRGRISAVRTKGVQRVFQVDAAVNPGNSGGPLFNIRGELIGILTTKFAHSSGTVPEGMGFAVPITYATPLLANIEDFDFRSIGKGRKTNTGDSVSAALVRTTVRIETVRVPDSAPSRPPAVSSRAPKEESASHAAPPNSTGVAQDTSVPATQEPAIVRNNEELQATQREELERLAKDGVHPPSDMVLVPAGEFWMGSDDGLPDARPMRRVYLSAYWFDKLQVTNDQYRRCVDSGGCVPPKDRTMYDNPRTGQQPVTNVTWSQAYHFCRWQTKRLPTEAEWEKAGRGTDARRYPWGNSDGLTKLIRQESATNHAPVDMAGSPYGAANLIGSVSEWVNDWYAADFYHTGPTHNPQGPVRGSFRALRGGQWSERLLELQVAYRGWDEVNYWGPGLGFRCAADIP